MDLLIIFIKTFVKTGLVVLLYVIVASLMLTGIRAVVVGGPNALVVPSPPNTDTAACQCP